MIQINNKEQDCRQFPKFQVYESSESCFPGLDIMVSDLPAVNLLLRNNLLIFALESRVSWINLYGGLLLLGLRRLLHHG